MSLRIEMPAVQYAHAVQVLQRAKRSWHQLDAALVDAQQVGGCDLEAVQVAVVALDRHLDRLMRLLAR
jgi:hypothetical protein